MLQKDNSKLQARVDDLETENADLRDDLANMQNEIGELKWRDDELEQYSRRNSFRISGIQENDELSTDEIIMAIANKYNIDVDIKDIDRSHRVGMKSDRRNRAISVKCTSYGEETRFGRRPIL